MRTIKARIVATGRWVPRRIDPSVTTETKTVKRSVVLSHAKTASHVDSPLEAERLVSRYFRCGDTTKGNVAATIAEIVAQRHHRGARKIRRGSVLEGCDFSVDSDRFEVKSVQKGNGSFVVNIGPHDRPRDRHKFPPHKYVFIRVLRMRRIAAEAVEVTYQRLVMPRQKLLGLMRSLSKQGKLRYFNGTPKLSPLQLGFPSLRHGPRAQMERLVKKF